MKKAKGANQKHAEVILRDGEKMMDYAVDYNPVTDQMESNGGKEHIVIYKNKRYAVVTDWHDKAFRATEVKDNE